MTLKQNNGVTIQTIAIFGEETANTLPKAIEGYEQWLGKVHHLVYAIRDYMTKADTGRRKVADILDLDYAGEYPHETLFAGQWISRTQSGLNTKQGAQFLFHQPTSQPKFYFIETEGGNHVFRERINSIVPSYANEIEEFLHLYGPLSCQQLGELLDDIEAGDEEPNEHVFERTSDLMDAVYNHMRDYSPDDWAASETISKQYEAFWEHNEEDFAERKLEEIFDKTDLGEFSYLAKCIDLTKAQCEMFEKTFSLRDCYIFKKDCF